MRILVQRVLKAIVKIEDKVHASIGPGLLVLVGVHKDDTLEQASWLAQKCTALRIFDDDNGKMNLSVEQIDGEILVVSQFTLYGNCMLGRRPAFTESAQGLEAKKQYHNFVSELRRFYPKVKTGVFKTFMQVELINDGPVTFFIEK